MEFQAFKDLARGERTATQMENQLTALERKIDDLLAQADAQERQYEGAAKVEAAQQSEQTRHSDTKP